MKVRSDDSRKIDELDLAIEALKDLTPPSALADQVRGGDTTYHRGRFVCDSSM